MSTTKWALDPTHSEVLVKVKHMMITNVTGVVQQFSIDVETEGDDFSVAKVNFVAKADSITTNNSDRDGHLKSPDFFDVANFSDITFVSNGCHKKDDENYELVGDLTIKNTTKSVTLNVEYAGLQVDPYGNTKAGFTVSAKINREDFGLTWNVPLASGGILVSQDVRINAEIQLIKQQ